jgi:undecaprenyl-phosphate galactose phosphotransferase
MSKSHKIKFYIYVKNALDFIIALIGFIFLIPCFLLVKIAYILTGDFKSIIYVQERIGYHGKKFNMYKFRSMGPNADDELKQLLKQRKYKKQWDLNHKLDDDPRITKIGKFLRKSSLDEIPQVINMLKGDMSLIGPRPLVDGELDAHNGNHKVYESVKPGLTGWWASHGRSSVDYNKRLRLEYYYAKNISFKLDIMCFIKTIKVVLTGKGAN